MLHAGSIGNAARVQAVIRGMIVQAALSDPMTAPLLAALQEEYRQYGALVAGDFEAYDGAEFRPPTGALLLVVEGGETIAGGALRRWADGTGEIKRMWTAPAHRRQGHSRRVLAELERVAVGCGYRTVRLETATGQTSAIALYRSAGYREIPPYGRLAGHARCVCFEKPL
jgi:ribosomal protein S18 acetylase RimI-like enzyme